MFLLNLEDGYFGCQVNESTDYLQLYNLSKLCDGNQDCFLGSDELSAELKCTSKSRSQFEELLTVSQIELIQFSSFCLQMTVIRKAHSAQMVFA